LWLQKTRVRYWQALGIVSSALEKWRNVSHTEFLVVVREYYEVYQQEDKCSPRSQVMNDIAMDAILYTKQRGNYL
jgi:hypothetical protein